MNLADLYKRATGAVKSAERGRRITGVVLAFGALYLVTRGDRGR